MTLTVTLATTFVAGLLVLGASVYYCFKSWQLLSKSRDESERCVSKAQYDSFICFFRFAAFFFLILALVLIFSNGREREMLAWVPVFAPVAILCHSVLKQRDTPPVSTLQSVRATLLPERTFMFGVVISMLAAIVVGGDFTKSDDLSSWFLSLIFYLPIQQIVVDARGQRPQRPVDNHL